MSQPSAEEFEVALRTLLRASYAYGRNVADCDQRSFQIAWDRAQTLLKRTYSGAELAQ